MTAQVKIVGISGSLRRGSYNSALLRLAPKVAPEGAQLELVSLAGIPFYNGDVEEEGMPTAVAEFRAGIRAADALLISTPEYNSSVPAVLKNAIDWASRPVAGQPPLVWYAGKVAGLMAASPGALGGLRGLAHVRQILSGIGVIVAPAQHAIARAGDAFDSAGALAEEPHGAAARRVVRETVRLAAKLSA